jgi:hypothetical protein
LLTVQEAAMRSRSRIIAILAVVLLLPIGLQAADSEPAAKPKAEDKPAAEATTEAARKAEPKCEYITGSHIRRSPKVKCEDGSPGLRVFTADDLQSTGETDLHEALRKLDTRMR